MRRATVAIFKKTIILSIILVALFALIFFAALYRLKQSPLYIDTNTSYVRPFLTFDGGEVQFKKLALYYDKSLKLRGSWVSLLDEKGRVTASADEVTFTFSNTNLMYGVLSPKSLAINGLSLDIEVLPDYFVVASKSFPFQSQSAGDSKKSGDGLFKFLNETGRQNLHFSALKSVNVTQADVRFNDRVRHKKWQMKNGHITFKKSFSDGEVLLLRGDIRVNDDVKETPAHMVVRHSNKQNSLSLRLRLDDVDASYANGYMPFSNPFTGRGSVAIETTMAANNTFENTQVSLQLGRGSIHIFDLYEFPLLYESADVSVRFPKKGDMHIDKLSVVDELGYKISVSGTVSSKEKRASLKLTTEGDTSVDRVAAYLPNKIMGGTVDWLNAHFTRSHVTDLSLDFDGSLNALSDCDGVCGLTGKFKFDQADLSLFDDRLKLHDLSGDFRLDGNKITVTSYVDGEDARAGDQRLNDISVTVWDYLKSGATPQLSISGAVSGALPGLVAELDKIVGGLGDTRHIALSGSHASLLKIQLPLTGTTLSNTRIHVESVVSDLSVPTLVPNVPISADKVSLKVTDGILRAEGHALLRGQAATVQWQEKLMEFGEHTRVEMAGHLPLGMMQPYISQADLEVAGAVPAIAKLSKAADGYQFDVRADFGDSDVSFSPLFWEKPAGIPLLLEANGGLSLDGGISIDRMRLHNVDTEIVGSAHYHEGLSLSLDTFNLAKNRLSVVFRDGQVKLSGAVLDLSRMKFAEIDESSSDAESHVSLDVDQLLLADAELLNVKGMLERGTDGKSTQFLTGAFANGETFVASIEREKSRTHVTLKSSDAGAFLQAMGATDALRKGRLDAKIELTDVDGVRKGKGAVTVRKTNLKDAPVLVSLLSVLSLEQLIKNDDGVYFDTIYLPLSVDGTKFEFDKLVLKGPSIGIELLGVLNTKDNSLKGRGQLVPLRGVNSFIDKIPLVGDLLTGSQDGVLVADFKVRGTLGDPEISANPFSIVTPGILKDLFRVVIP